ncbi:MAG: hypothetical protein OSJ58_03930 [Dysosmobacter sp.]|nr:hypothetical protein [Dysosmobacter sp.]
MDIRSQNYTITAFKILGKHSRVKMPKKRRGISWRAPDCFCPLPCPAAFVRLSSFVDFEGCDKVFLKTGKIGGPLDNDEISGAIRMLVKIVGCKENPFSSAVRG